MSLLNAEKIRQSGLAQLSSLKKSYEEEAERAHESVDYLEGELKRSYWNLAAKVGKHRTDEIMSELIKLPW